MWKAKILWKILLEWLFYPCIPSSSHIISYLFEKIRKLMHLYFISLCHLCPEFFVASDVPFILTVALFYLFLFLFWFLALCYLSSSITYNFFFEPVSGNILLPTSLILWQNNYLHFSMVPLGNSSCEVCISCVFVLPSCLIWRWGVGDYF